MRKLKSLALVLEAILLLIACEKEKPSGDKEYKIIHWPAVKTIEVTNLTYTTATLNGTVNPNGLPTTVTFEYGITASYGITVTALQSLVTGNSVTEVSADISGLLPKVTYHFRVKAENSVWKNFYSSDKTFYSGQIPPKNGLIVDWPFFGNANDESVNGNHGIVQGATLTADRFGNENSAYYFDGNRQYIISKDVINISGAMPRTISVWVKWLVNDYSPEPGEHDILGWGDQGDDGNFSWLHMHNYQGQNLPFGHAIFHGHGMDLHSSVTTEKNKWAHIVFWYDGTTLKFFINGMECPDTGSFILKTIPTVLNIGYMGPGFEDNGGWNTAFKGWIDDIRIYNRALSTEEINSLYSPGSY